MLKSQKYNIDGLSITLHNEEEFASMRKAGSLAATILDNLFDILIWEVI